MIVARPAGEPAGRAFWFGGINKEGSNVISLGKTSVLAACAVALWAAGAHAVTADPAEVVFTRRDQAHTIQFTHEGKPLKAEDIKGYEVYVEKNTYKQFFKYQVGPGTLTLMPSELVETGTWDLVVNTTYGAVKVDLKTPLNEDPDSLETRARELGVTVDELRIQMGLGIELPRGQIRFDIAPQYNVGQSLRLQIQPVAGRTYTWRVNGHAVKEGPGAEDFTLTFAQEGPHTITLEERENGAVTASTSFSTTVSGTSAAASAGQDTTVRVNTDVTLNGPAGY
jgi:hypothetical protein